MRKTILIFMLLGSVFFPFRAMAICEGPLVPCGRCCKDMTADGICLEACDGVTPKWVANRCTLCHLFELLSNVLEFLLTCLAPIVAVLMLTVGGVLFILSQFNIVSVNIFSQAKSIVTAVVVGIVIIFASYIFLNAFLSTIGYADWTGLGTWWQINCN